VSVALGEATFTASGVDVPLELGGVHALGGAIVRLVYPGDRYTATLTPAQTQDEWLPISDIQDGVTTLGLIRIGPTPREQLLRNAPWRATLHLTLRAGQSHGGAVTLTEAQLSGVDGVKLEGEVAREPVALGGPPALALTAARPNPFGGVTRLELTVDRPAQVTVAIYDLGGRLVTTLHRGSLLVGTHAFTWDGTRAGGVPVRRGVYFYRAAAGDVVRSRKLVLLGN